MEDKPQIPITLEQTEQLRQHVRVNPDKIVCGSPYSFRRIELKHVTTSRMHQMKCLGIILDEN